jgi:hypothetical protein
MVSKPAGARGGSALPHEPPGLAPTDPVGAKVLVLDPSTAYRTKTGADPRPTTFMADALLVRGRHPATWDALRRVAADAGFLLHQEEGDTLHRDLLDEAGLSDERRAELADRWVERVRLRPDPAREDDVFRPIDTWRLLQSYRTAVGDDRARQTDVGL